MQISGTFCPNEDKNPELESKLKVKSKDNIVIKIITIKLNHLHNNYQKTHIKDLKLKS
jgi:hypothetical protein